MDSKKKKAINKFLEHRTFRNEQSYKQYKNLFEKTKNAAKKHHYSKLLEENQNNSKKTWEIRKLLINNNEIFDKDLIANNLNDYFTNVGPNLAKNIPITEKHFSDYINKADKVLAETNLTLKEFEAAFKQ